MTCFSEAGPSSPWRILVVDDDPDILELLSLRLTAQGYALQTAMDGEKALQVIPTFRPHLVLCDILMPRMDGQTFCKRLRAENDSTPILFLTAKGQPRDKVEALSAGGDDYIVKPFDPKELLARIAGMLRRLHPNT